MKEPVSPSEDDIDPGVEIIREYLPEELGQRARAQFFYHSSGNDLPVRDVTDTQGAGKKVEPCIERKAENYCTNCIQWNISSFAENIDERYLFLFTRCRNSDLDENGDQRYIGYIDKRRVLNINGRTAVQGPIKLVSFQDSCPLELVGSPNTRNQKRLNEEQAEKVLEHLSGATNIYYECVEEVERLEKKVGRPRLWEEKSVPVPEEDDFLQDSTGC